MKKAFSLILTSMVLVTLILVPAGPSASEKKITPEMEKWLAQRVIEYYMEREEIDELRGKEVIWLSNDFYKRSSTFHGNFYSYQSVSEKKPWLIALAGTRPEGWLITTPIYMCTYEYRKHKLGKSWARDKAARFFGDGLCTTLDDFPDHLNLQMFFHEYDLSQINGEENS